VEGLLEKAVDGLLEGEKDGRTEEEAEGSSVGPLRPEAVNGVAEGETEGLHEGEADGLVERDDGECTEEETEGSSVLLLLLLLRLLLGEPEGKVEGLLEGGTTTVPATAANVVVAGVGVVGAVFVVMGCLSRGKYSSKRGQLRRGGRSQRACPPTMLARGVYFGFRARSVRPHPFGRGLGRHPWPSVLDHCPASSPRAL